MVTVKLFLYDLKSFSYYFVFAEYAVSYMRIVFCRCWIRLFASLLFFCLKPLWISKYWNKSIFIINFFLILFTFICRLLLFYLIRSTNKEVVAVVLFVVVVSLIFFSRFRQKKTWLQFFLYAIKIIKRKLACILIDLNKFRFIFMCEFLPFFLFFIFHV